MELCSCYNGVCNAFQRFRRKCLKKNRWISQDDEENIVVGKPRKFSPGQELNQGLGNEAETCVTSEDDNSEDEDQFEAVEINVRRLNLETVSRGRRRSDPPCEIQRYSSDKDFSKLIDEGYRQHVRIQHGNQRHVRTKKELLHSTKSL